MLSKQTVLNQIEVTENNSIQLRFAFKILDNQKEISCNWHRAILQPGVDFDLAIQELNTAFSSMGKDPISEQDVAKIKTIISAVWTPEVISDYQLSLKQQK